MASERLVEWIATLDADHLVEVVRRVYKARGNAVAVRTREGETYLLYQDRRKDPDAAGFDGVVWVAAGDPPTAAELASFRELRDDLDAGTGTVVDTTGAAADADPGDLEVLDDEGLAAAIEAHAIAAGAEAPADGAGSQGGAGDGDVGVEEWIPPPPAEDAPPRTESEDDPSRREPEEGTNRPSEAGGSRPGGGPGDPRAGRPPENRPPETRGRDEYGGRDEPRAERAPRREPGSDGGSGRDAEPAGRGARRERPRPRRRKRRDRQLGPRSTSARIVVALILLALALVVVALVATSGGSGGFLQTKSEQTGQESAQRVTDVLDPVTKRGTVTPRGTVGELEIVLELAAGVDRSDLSAADIEVVGPGPSRTVSVSDPGVSIAAVNDDDGSLAPGSYVLNDATDRVALTLALGPDGATGELDPGEEATVRITTADGRVSTVEVSVPGTLSGEEVSV